MAEAPTRRDFIGCVAAGLAVSAATVREAEAFFLPGPPPSVASAPSRPVVAIARREGMIDRPAGKLDMRKVQEALGAAVSRAAGEKTAVDAFRKLFTPRDVVGIKVNCLAGRGLSTRPEVAAQIAIWLQVAGVPPGQIVIWDRTERELKSAGFSPSQSGPRVIGTDGDYEGRLREWGPGASRFARLLVEDLTAIIDVPLLKDHGLSGVSLGMKNLYGTIHNPNKLHDEGCNPFLPHLSAFPLLREKLRLTVVDGTTGQCHGGPGFSPAWAWEYQGFLASTDIVAVDAAGWRVLEERRKSQGLKSLALEGREPRYIREAQKLGLGVGDEARVDVRNV